MNTSLEFLQFVRPSGPWTLTAIHPDGKDAIETKTFEANQTNELVKWVAAREGKRNLYWGANPSIKAESKKASRDNIKCMSLLHVDLDPRVGEDLDSERERIQALLTTNIPEGVSPPSIIIFSGGGYQALWLLVEPFEINGNLALAEEAARYNMQLELLLGGDATHDVSRILRLPYTTNIPGEKKLKKGRQAVMSYVVGWKELYYPLTHFKPAQLVQSHEAKDNRGVEISGNIARLNGIDDLDQYSVPDYIKDLILEGMAPKYPSRSEALWAVCCNLVRCGVPNEVIFSVINDPDFRISASVIEKGARAERYAKQQIRRALDEAQDKKLMEYNQQHAVIRHHGRNCMVITEMQDATGRPHLMRSMPKSFMDAYCNDRAEVKVKDKDGNESTKMVPAGKWWFEHPNRRQYDTIVFAPCQDVPNAYNLWRGFACEATPGDKHDSFLKHVFENVCSSDEQHYTYLIGWMARAVQQPNKAGMTAIILCGGEGVGKSFFANTFGSLFGQHYLKVAHSSQLVGNFNGHLQDTVVLFADEGFYAGDKQHSNVLKDLITGETLTIERKYEQAENMDNYVHLIMASNSDWVVPAGVDARRYFVLDVGAAKKNNHDYFEAIERDMNAGGRESLLYFLRHVDLGSFNVRAVPHTIGLTRQKELSMAIEDVWWETKLRDGALFAQDAEWRDAVPQKELYDDYTEFANQQRAYRPMTPIAFNRYIKRITDDKAKSTRPRASKKRERFWELPSLEQCRSSWDTRLRTVTNWDTDEEFDEEDANSAPAIF